MRTRDPWLWAALAATLLSLLLGYALKTSCEDNGSWLCYSDIPVLYSDAGPAGFERGIESGLLPYVEGFSEYPVLTGMWMYVAGHLSADREEFLLVNAVGLGVLALATTYVLCRMADRRRVFFWALAPSLVLYAFHNWDLLAVLLAVLGLWAHQRGRPLEAGVFLALGASAKIWPGLFLPMIGLEVLRGEVRQRSWGRDPRTWLGPRSWRFGLGSVGALAVVNLPFLALNPRLFLATYRFHAGRGPTFESIWHVMRTYGERWDVASLEALTREEVLPPLTRGLLILGLVALGWAVWRRHLTGLEAAFGALLVFLLANVVFSVQYILWVVPFLALLRIPWERIALLYAADAVIYLALFRYFQHMYTPQAAHWYDAMALGSVLRHLALLGLLAWVVMAGVRRRRAAVAEVAPVVQGQEA